MILASNPWRRAGTTVPRALPAALGAALLTMFVIAPASAQISGGQKVEDHGAPQVLVGPDCDITGYKGEARQFVPALVIPDDTPAGITTPVIIIPADGDIIDDVVIKLNASHTWIGDLIVTVRYDVDCDGPAAPISAVLLCRPDVSGDPSSTPPPCGTNAAALGCASNLDCNNTYAFSDAGVASLGQGTFCGATSSTVLPAGCYKPGVGGTPLDVFRGLPKGGCWTLTISDNAALDTGVLCSWGVFLHNQHPVPALSSSWGNVKNLYR